MPRFIALQCVRAPQNVEFAVQLGKTFYSLQSNVEECLLHVRDIQLFVTRDVKTQHKHMY